MKRITILAATLFALSGLQAQTGIDGVLRNIETNNKELQANAQLIASQKLETRTDNNLPDPTLSYAHLWNNKDKNNTIGELVVSQSFDFPSLYATRNQLNRLKAGAFDGQKSVFRQGILLQAKDVCLDIIMLRKQQQILTERLRNAEELSAMYAKRLQTGDANVIETNKINLELLNVKTEASLNETALRNKIQELTALNGNIPVVFEDADYPAVIFPSNYEELQYWLHYLLQDTVSGPRAIRYPRGGESAKLAQYPCTKREYDFLYETPGAEILLVSYADELEDILEAANQLNAASQNADVLRLVKLYPFTDKLIDTVSKYKIVLFAEECVAAGGIGEHLAYALQQKGWNGRFLHCAVHTACLPHATVPQIKQCTGLDAADLVQAVRSALTKGENEL